jgi:galactonate dehydratase
LPEAGRIVSIEALPVSVGAHSRTLIQLTTTEGITGVGEATFRDSTEVVVAAVRELARSLRDEDASRTAHLVRMMEVSCGGSPGPERTAAIAGIDEALWDVKAKALGVPAYELLGGQAREWIDLYASSAGGLTRAEIVGWAAAAVAEGFGSLVLRPLGPEGTGGSASGIVREILSSVRAEVGSDVRLGVDLEGRLCHSAAKAIIRSIEPCEPWFVSGAAGGGVAGIWELDLARSGGLLAARRRAWEIEQRGGTIVLRSDLTPVTTMASAHLAMATPNVIALEWRVDDPLWRDKLVLEAPCSRDGRLWVTRTPGLGVSLDLDHCHAHPYMPHPARVERRSDGSLA